MSTRNVGNPLQGRRLKGGNNGQKLIEIKAAIGDGSTANTATPFVKLTGTSASSTDGDNNVTTADITGSGAAPTGASKGVLVDMNGTSYWLALYAIT